MAPRAIRDSGGPAKAADNAAKAAWLWSRREPISENCPAGLYLRRTRRYHGPIPPTLGYFPPKGKHPAAMIAAFGFCDEPEPGVINPPAIVAGVHITRLTPGGGKAPIDPVKIMLGPMSGLPIVLAPVNDGLGLAITEGIEDGLSVSEETGLGVWAAGSAGNMSKIAAAHLANQTGVEIAISDGDKNGFMTTIHQLKREEGLDLLLHTPGGSMAATKSLVAYLRNMFEGNIRAFVPQIAMSAGTMTACSCSEIFMGSGGDGVTM